MLRPLRADNVHRPAPHPDLPAGAPVLPGRDAEAAAVQLRVPGQQSRVVRLLDPAGGPAT